MKLIRNQLMNKTFSKRIFTANIMVLQKFKNSLV